MDFLSPPPLCLVSQLQTFLWLLLPNPLTQQRWTTPIGDVALRMLGAQERLRVLTYPRRLGGERWDGDWTW